MWQRDCHNSNFLLLISFDTNLNQHVLTPNKQYWNNYPRKLKFIFFIENSDPTFIIETRTKGIGITPWPSDYNWITNQRYKVWTIQGKSLISSQFLKNQKKSKASPFLNFIQWSSLLQWVHATYKGWLKIENMKNVLNNKTLNKSWFGLKLAYLK